MATLYKATNTKTGAERLIRGANQAAVGRFIASDWEIKPASSEDVWHLASVKGVTAEDSYPPATTEPPAAA